MAKKFNINAEGAGALMASVERQTGKTKQGTATPEEKAAREAEGRTQGRKGCKAPRINLALTSENWDFISKWKGGQAPTKFINKIIETYRKEHTNDLIREQEEYLNQMREEAKAARK